MQAVAGLSDHKGKQWERVQWSPHTSECSPWIAYKAGGSHLSVTNWISQWLVCLTTSQRLPRRCQYKPGRLGPPAARPRQCEGCCHPYRSRPPPETPVASVGTRKTRPLLEDWCEDRNDPPPCRQSKSSTVHRMFHANVRKDSDATFPCGLAEKKLWETNRTIGVPTNQPRRHLLPRNNQMPWVPAKAVDDLVQPCIKWHLVVRQLVVGLGRTRLCQKECNKKCLVNISCSLVLWGSKMLLMLWRHSCNMLYHTHESVIWHDSFVLGKLKLGFDDFLLWPCWFDCMLCVWTLPIIDHHTHQTSTYLQCLEALCPKRTRNRSISAVRSSHPKMSKMSKIIQDPISFHKGFDPEPYIFG